MEFGEYGKVEVEGGRDEGGSCDFQLRAIRIFSLQAAFKSGTGLGRGPDAGFLGIGVDDECETGAENESDDFHGAAVVGLAGLEEYSWKIYLLRSSECIRGRNVLMHRFLTSSSHF